MAFKVIGTGPQFPTPYIRNVSTAAEALGLYQPTRKLCGHVTIEASGREVSLAELTRLAQRDH